VYDRPKILFLTKYAIFQLRFWRFCGCFQPAQRLACRWGVFSLSLCGLCGEQSGRTALHKLRVLSRGWIKTRKKFLWLA